VNRHSHDERLTEAQRDAVDASYDALAARGGSSGNSGGAGAAGAVMVPMIIIGSIVVFMLYACFYPVAAMVGLVTGLIVMRIYDALVPGVGWIMHFLVMLPFAFSALMLFRAQLEWRLERNRTYLLVRHALRLVFTAVIVGLSTTFFTQQENLRERRLLEDPSAWLHLAIVIAAVVLVHFVGRWQDRRLVVESSASPGWSPASSPRRSRLQIPGMEFMPSALRRGLPAMTVAGGVFGSFLGYAGFETATSTLVGLFAGCVGGALLMFVCWVITRPVSGLFDKLPILWPLLMGAIIGAGVGVRLGTVDKVASLSTYLVPGVVGGALALAVPYLLYALVRRVVVRPA
jgi:hypothetical protein